jgi:hypothetical protein
LTAITGTCDGGLRVKLSSGIVASRCERLSAVWTTVTVDRESARAGAVRDPRHPHIVIAAVSASRSPCRERLEEAPDTIASQRSHISTSASQLGETAGIDWRRPPEEVRVARGVPDPDAIDRAGVDRQCHA